MSYRGVKVLVTGADGFIGSHLTEALVKLGADVTVLCLYNSGDHFGWIDDVPHSVYSSLTAVRGDIRDAAFVRRLVEIQDIVFHLAALIAIPQSYIAPQSYVDTNILGTLNILETARDSGIKRVIHTSTSEVYGTAITLPIDETHPLHGQSPYSASKIGADMMAEAFARSFELPVAILRPFNTFGPRQSERAIISTVIRQVLDPTCPVLHVGDISTIRDFTFVYDTVAAFLALGAADNIAFGQPYNAGSGRAVSIKELLELIFTLTGIEKPIRQDSVRMRPCASEVRALLADSSRLTTVCGWRPRITLEEGLALTIAWWRGRLETGHVRRQTQFVA